MSNIEIEDHSAEVLAAKQAAIRGFLTEAGLHLAGQAAKALEMSPRRVDTGLLRNSITYALDGDGPAVTAYHGDRSSKYDSIQVVPIGSYSGTMPEEPAGKDAVYIGTNVEYAIYVHEGTSGMPPNRFLKNAVELNSSQLQRKLEETLKNA